MHIVMMIQIKKSYCKNSWIFWRSGLSIKGVNQTIKHETNKQKEGFLKTLGASLLGNHNQRKHNQSRQRYY